ncbi:MAG: outer membrane protein assembly factor BamA [Bacteroidota bacterium]
MMKYCWTLIVVFLSFNFLAAQSAFDSLQVFDYSQPQELEIGEVKVSGANFSDDNAIISISGLKVGETIRIPGSKIPKAIRSLWKLRLFTNVQVYETKRVDDVIFLEIAVQERPRLSGHSYVNTKKTFHEDLNDKVNAFLLKGGIVTEDIKVNAAEAIEEYFIEKGYLDTEVSVSEVPDSARANAVRLIFDVQRNDRVKIQEIAFKGNDAVKDKKLRGLMKNTRRKKRLFASSKFIKDQYEEDKEALITYYNTIGFRDARIMEENISRNEDGELILELDVFEGNQYYFRDITWKGNSIYASEDLDRILGIEAGDVYNQELLDTRLNFSQDNRDISSLYLNRGYLFFNADPVETAIENDSIDLEVRIFEGPQATIDKVTIAGNDRTHEHVIRRELRTLPGKKFSREDIIRSQRQIINLGYFNPESLGINTPVNPERGTVDIEYTVEEKPSDQLELSAGWGGFRGLIGTLGVSFNNFSLRNINKKETWNPLPQGDGQRLSIRAQTNGRFFQSYNASFTEPWLGGKKPTSFTLGGFYNRFSQGFSFDRNAVLPTLNIIQGSATLGTRLSWPDDNFVSSTAVNIQNLILTDWRGFFRSDDGQLITNGTFKNFSIRQTIARSTVNAPIFPESGSSISLSVQFTPPYSLFRGEPDVPYAEQPVSERYEWIEYHKWRFDAEWYTPLFDKFVLKTSAKLGIIGSYNDDIGVSPFERFQLGGDGLNNQQFGFAGVDIISMRGYEIEDFPANQDPSGTSSSNVATPIFNKFTLEMRYPITTNPNSTIYLHTFLQAGNTWRQMKDFNPFDVRRAVGGGLRVFLPMFGVLGFDYGIGFDKPGSTFEELGTFNIVLGFEPE